MITEKRKLWIDNLRAMAIILVVYGHCARNFYPYFVFTNAFKMPLFFAISGYLFNVREGKQLSFYKNLLFHLIIPWFCLAIPPQLILYICHHKAMEIFTYIINLILGKVLWFMPCFIISIIIHFYIIKYSNNNFKNIVLCCSLIFIIGIILIKFNIPSYFMFIQAMFVQIYFIVGIVYKKIENNSQNLGICRNNLIILLSCIIIYIVICILSYKLFKNNIMEVHWNEYFNIPYCLIMVYISCLSLFYLFSKYKISFPLLNNIGKSTLLIYIWHEYILELINKTLLIFKINLPRSNPVNAIGYTLVTCTICSIFYTIIERLCPIMIGLKHKK